MGNFQDLVPVEWKRERVLTTAQLAEAYSTPDKIVTANMLKNNFRNNRDRFVESKHFFKIDGDDLDNLRCKYPTLQISPMTRSLYLWTTAGFFIFAKLLSTDRAWEILSQIGEIMSSSPYIDKILYEGIQAPAKTPNLACVYALEFSDKIVKIGMTGNFEARQDAIRHALQLEITRRHHTPFMPRKEAHRIENSCHETFKARLAHHREYFNITFEEACTELDRHTAEFQSANLVMGEKAF